MLAGHASRRRILLRPLAIVKERCGWREGLLSTLLEELLVSTDILWSGIEVDDAIVANVVRMMLMHVIVGKTTVLPRRKLSAVDCSA